MMNAILGVKVSIAKAVNAPAGYAQFDRGASKKFVIDPHGVAARWVIVTSTKGLAHDRQQ